MNQVIKFECPFCGKTLTQVKFDTPNEFTCTNSDCPANDDDFEFPSENITLQFAKESIN